MACTSKGSDDARTILFVDAAEKRKRPRLEAKCRSNNILICRIPLAGTGTDKFRTSWLGWPALVAVDHPVDPSPSITLLACALPLPIFILPKL